MQSLMDSERNDKRSSSAIHRIYMEQSALWTASTMISAIKRYPQNLYGTKRLIDNERNDKRSSSTIHRNSY